MFVCFFAKRNRKCFHINVDDVHIADRLDKKFMGLGRIWLEVYIGRGQVRIGQAVTKLRYHLWNCFCLYFSRFRIGCVAGKDSPEICKIGIRKGLCHALH